MKKKCLNSVTLNKNVIKLYYRTISNSSKKKLFGYTIESFYWKGFLIFKIK